MARQEVPFTSKTYEQQLKTLQNLRYKKQFDKVNEYLPLLKKVPTSISTKSRSKIKVESKVDKIEVAMAANDYTSRVSKKTTLTLVKPIVETVVSSIVNNEVTAEVGATLIKEGNFGELEKTVNSETTFIPSEYIKSIVLKKLEHTIKVVCAFNYSQIIKVIGQILLLLLIAVPCTMFLISKASEAYELMHFNAPVKLAGGVVAIAVVTSFWSAFNRSKLLKFILATILLFEVVVLLIGAELKLTKLKTDTLIEKTKTTESIIIIESQIKDAKEELKKFDDSTEKDLKNKNDMIDIQRKMNVYSAKGGVFDLSNQLAEYTKVRAKDRREILDRTNLYAQENNLIKLKAKAIDLESKNFIFGDIIMKFFIFAVILLNLFVVNKIGSRLQEF